MSVSNVFGYNVEGNAGFNPFPDVNQGDWFDPYVSTAYLEGMVIGYPDGYFRPNQNITRAEALRVVFDALKFDEDEYYGETGFDDVPSYAWYYSYVVYAEKNDIISGFDENTFGPDDVMSRAEAAKVIFLMMDRGWFNYLASYL